MQLRAFAGQGRRDVRSGEIIALGQERLTSRFGEGVGTVAACDRTAASVGPHRNSAQAIALMPSGSSALSHFRSCASSREPPVSPRIRKLVSRWIIPGTRRRCVPPSPGVPASPRPPGFRRFLDPAQAGSASGRAPQALRCRRSAPVAPRCEWRGGSGRVPVLRQAFQLPHGFDVERAGRLCGDGGHEFTVRPYQARIQAVRANARAIASHTSFCARTAPSIIGAMVKNP